MIHSPAEYARFDITTCYYMLAHSYAKQQSSKPEKIIKKSLTANNPGPTSPCPSEKERSPTRIDHLCIILPFPLVPYRRNILVPFSTRASQNHSANSRHNVGPTSARRVPHRTCAQTCRSRGGRSRKARSFPFVLRERTCLLQQCLVHRVVEPHALQAHTGDFQSAGCVEL